MEKVYRDWTKLPYEILHEIIQHADERPYTNDTRNLALVCKAWLDPTQAVLYKTVPIKTYSQYKKFHNTITSTPQLGRKVKILKLENSLVKGADQWDALKTSHLLIKSVSACLVNLEEIQDQNGISYYPTLKALQNSQLKRLKKLGTPTNESSATDVDNYVACALLLRDRLENFRIVERINSKQVYWNQLYEKLHQFPNLLDLTVIKGTYEDIQVFEHITTTCRSLRVINFSYFIPEEEAIQELWNNNISSYAIENYIPAPNIEEIVASIIVPSDYKILLYIMHKFPRLRYLSLELSKGAPLDHQILTQLLDYSSNIKDFVIFGIRADYDIFCGLIGEYWNAMSKPGKEVLMIDYSNEVEKEETCVFELGRGFDYPDNTLTLYYPLSNLNWKYIDFIKKYGKHVIDLEIKFTVKRSSQRQATRVLPKDFLHQVLTYCPNLHSIGFENCELKRLSYSSIDLRQVRSLNGLSAIGCIIYSGVIEQMSLLFCNIKKLYIDGFISGILLGHPPIFGPPFYNRPIEIIMPYTEIETIVFDELYTNEVLYIKVLDITTKINYYYRFDKTVDPTSEQEYNETTNDKEHVYISCRTKPKFKLEFELM